METQEIFNRSAKHLLAQNQKSEEPSSGDGMLSRYRYGELQCAVGCLIDQKYYSPKLERKLADDAKVIRAVEKSLQCTLSQDQIELLQELQGIHDRVAPSLWSHELRELAAAFELTDEMLC